MDADEEMRRWVEMKRDEGGRSRRVIVLVFVILGVMLVLGWALSLAFEAATRNMVQ